MSKLIASAVAVVFAASGLCSVAYAQYGDQKKEQVHKGTPEAGTVQKKDQKKAQKKAQKKDGSGAAKKADATK